MKDFNFYDYLAIKITGFKIAIYIAVALLLIRFLPLLWDYILIGH